MKALRSVLLIAILFCVRPVAAQPPAKSESKPAAKSSTKPEKPVEKDAKPAEKPAADAAAAKPKEQKDQGDPLAKIFGDGEVNLKTEKMFLEVDPQTNELQTMRIKGGVNIVSDLMNLECDELDIDMVKQQMVARGQLVKFQKQDVGGTCGRLTYDIETKKTLLEGKPKPLIRQKDANGRITQTSAHVITMIQTEKANNITWDGDVEFKVLPAPDAGKKDGGKTEPAQKLENGATEKLRVPSFDGR